MHCRGSARRGTCAQILTSLAASGVLLLSACDTVAGPHALAEAPMLTARARPAAPPAPPVLESSTPRYPAAVIYILYREYLHRNPGLTSLGADDPRYQAYVERRLRELYPARGYSGMMRDAVAEARRNQAAWRKYEHDLRTSGAGDPSLAGCDTQVMSAAPSPTACSPDPVEEEEADPYADPLVDPSWSGQEEFAVPADSLIPTIPMEIDTLRLQGAEVDSIYYYESLAQGTYREPIQMTGADAGPSINDLIRAAGGGGLPAGQEPTIQVSPEFVAGVVVSLGVIGWKAFRVKQATDRAIRKSGEWFPMLGYSDTKRDAARHIYWSMMLRRYVGAFLAREITDAHEGNSSGAPRVMDLHNNDIGRSYRYKRFRGDWLWDRWDWQKWGSRVRDYIYFSSDNAVYIPEWKDSAPTTAQAWQREATVPDTRYIYFRP